MSLERANLSLINLLQVSAHLHLTSFLGFLLVLALYPLFGTIVTLSGNLFSGWILSFKKTKRGQTNRSVGRGRQAESYRGSDGYWGCLVYRKSQREAQKEGPTAAVGLGVVLQEVLRRCILTGEQRGTEQSPEQPAN